MYELRIGKARPVGGSTTLGPPGRLRCRQRPEAYHADRIWARSEQAALDLSQIDGFEWDEGNNRKGVEKHDVSQAEAEQTFFNEPLLILEDVSHNSHQPMWHALGHTDAGRLLHISFTLRRDGKLIRIISARAMHRKERLRYEKEA